MTSSTGRVLDAVSAMLGVCREKTYDGEPAMRLESAAVRGRPQVWDLAYTHDGRCEILSTTTLCRRAVTEYCLGNPADAQKIADIAASFQFNLARGIAGLAVHAARERGIDQVILSGGVAYNHAIRTAITDQVKSAGLELVINADLPLGDGCISFGQCMYAGILKHR
jgi:hydrogenase maturation protein HypF